MADKLISLIDRKEIAQDTMAFWFDIGGLDFSFKAGQYADLTLIDPMYSDAEGSTRSFSITSSPNDSDRIMMAMRMRPTAFKNSLKEAPLGMVAKISDPMGSLTLHKDHSKPAVFVAGGIGVTPFRSIVSWASEEEIPCDIYLFYSNHTPTTTPFINDFENWAKSNKRFHFIPTITKSDDSEWKYEKGRITPEMINKHVHNLADAVCYITGSPTMISGMLPALTKAGANEDMIRTEDFTGY